MVAKLYFCLYFIALIQHKCSIICECVLGLIKHTMVINTLRWDECLNTCGEGKEKRFPDLM